MPMPITRRQFMVNAGLGTLSLALSTSAFAKTTPQVWIVSVSKNGQLSPPQRVNKIIKTPAQWRTLLTPQAYEVTREAGTEAPYTGQYWDEHAQGIYRCVCCDTALFNSNTKFDSHTGWPSFYAPIAAENVRQKPDRSIGMLRTEVNCSRCDAHLGHVFDDGPVPTGLRYCMNSVALTLIPFV